MGVKLFEKGEQGPVALFADQFLEVRELLLDDASHFFGSAFRLEVGIVFQLSLSLFRRPFCVVKIAFNLLPRAVCHVVPGTRLVLDTCTSPILVARMRPNERDAGDNRRVRVPFS